MIWLALAAGGCQERDLQGERSAGVAMARSAQAQSGLLRTFFSSSLLIFLMRF